MNIKDFFRTLKDFAQKSKMNTILVNVFCVVAVAAPFFLTIALAVPPLSRVSEAGSMVLAFVLFVGFIVTYIFFTKFMNKV